MFYPYFGYPRVPQSSAARLRSSELENQRYEEELNKRKALFIEACKSGDLKVVADQLKSQLYQIALNPNFIYEMNTPLCVSVQFGHMNIVRMLLGRGAKIDMPNGNNRTPLLESVAHKRELMTILLLENNAKIELVAMQTTVLHFAAFEDNVAILKILLLNSTAQQLNFRDKEGKTALYRAVECGNEAAVKHLVISGSDTTIGDLKGVKPIDVVLQKKGISEKTRNNLIGILVNPIQEMSNKMTALLRLHPLLGRQCSFAFNSVLENLLFSYASTPSGQEILNRVIVKSLTSKNIITFAENRIKHSKL